MSKWSNREALLMTYGYTAWNDRRSRVGKSLRCMSIQPIPPSMPHCGLGNSGMGLSLSSTCTRPVGNLQQEKIQ